MKIRKEPQTCVIAMIFFAVCMGICFIGAFAAENDNDAKASEILELTVESAEILSSEGVSGERSVSFSGDVITAELGTFTHPGAYAEIAVTVINSGTLTAYLDSEQHADCGLEDIFVSFPQFGEDERIDPDERCSFTLVVQWDGTSELCYDEEQTGSFSLELSYINDDAKSDSGDSSDINSSDTEEESSLYTSGGDSSEDVKESVTDVSGGDSSGAAEESGADASVDDVSSDQAKNSLSSDPDENSGTGALYGKNMLLFLSAAFAFCAAMCAVQLKNGKKDGDEIR